MTEPGFPHSPSWISQLWMWAGLTLEIWCGLPLITSWNSAAGALISTSTSNLPTKDIFVASLDDIMNQILFNRWCRRSLCWRMLVCGLYIEEYVWLYTAKEHYPNNIYKSNTLQLKCWLVDDLRNYDKTYNKWINTTMST